MALSVEGFQANAATLKGFQKTRPYVRYFGQKQGMYLVIFMFDGSVLDADSAAQRLIADEAKSKNKIKVDGGEHLKFAQLQGKELVGTMTLANGQKWRWVADLVGTPWKRTSNDVGDAFWWARNDGTGGFEILDAGTSSGADRTFLQGVAPGPYEPGAAVEVALSWQGGEEGGSGVELLVASTPLPPLFRSSLFRNSKKELATMIPWLLFPVA